MATSSRKRLLSKCEQVCDINRTSKRVKVHEGDGHYMEDALILGVIFLDTYSSCCDRGGTPHCQPFNLTYSGRDVITTISHKTKTDHRAISWRADKKTVLEYPGESSDD